MMMESSSSPSTHLLALPSSSTKKPPPLPWTHQETLNLIHSYQLKWYSLKRGQLKATQWDQVSSAVPTKTSTQCRHKMEKLRKRYRAERLKPYPDSWPYFHLMDNMERGPVPFPAHPVSAVKMPNHHHHDRDDDDFGDGIDGSRNKCKSINHILRDGVGDVYGSGGGESRKVSIGGDEAVRECFMMDGRKRRGDYVDCEDEDEEVDVDVDGEGDDDVGGPDGGMELAEEISEFAEKFMRVEKMRMEMTRETERYRMEMERRRMEMIVDSQRKIVDMIGKAFRAHKKLNTGPEL